MAEVQRIIDGILDAPLTEERGEKAHALMHGDKKNASNATLGWLGSKMKTGTNLDIFFNQLTNGEKVVFMDESKNYKRIVQVDPHVAQRFAIMSHSAVVERVYDMRLGPWLRNLVSFPKEVCRRG